MDVTKRQRRPVHLAIGRTRTTLTAFLAVQLLTMKR